jgi:hypothetical protein
MKKSFNLTLAGIFPAIIFIVIGCASKGSDPQPDAQVKGMLTSGTWKLQSATVDGTDKTPVYNGLTLTFSDTQFNSSPPDPIWPVSGTWSFTDQAENAIVRNDGLQIAITEISTSKLSLKLTWTSTTLSGGRIESLAGVHVFVFGK